MSSSNKKQISELCPCCKTRDEIIGKLIQVKSKDLYNSEWIEIDGNKVHRTALIADTVKLGKGNVIYPYAVIGYRGFVRSEEELTGSVTIGNNNRIGAHAFIAHDVVIGDDNILMSYVNIGHNCKIGNTNEIGAKSIFCGHVTIGNYNKIKVSVSVRNRLLIGNATLIGMGSVVVKNVTNGKEVKGNPAK